MPATRPDAPHFLRVVRSLANVRGAAIPAAAVVVTVVAGVYTGCAGGCGFNGEGVCGAGVGAGAGAGGADAGGNGG
jgi:hypothetical protein